MSQAVEWALYWGVSRNKSAKNPLLMWSSLLVTSLNTILSGLIPAKTAVDLKLDSASRAFGNRRSHNIELGTRFNIDIHAV